MTKKKERTVYDKKSPGLNNRETFVVTLKRFNTYLVLIVSDLNKAQIYELLYRESPYHEIEKLMRFKYLKLFKPKELTED